MPKFISREKLGKKTRRALDAEKRATWGFSPVTRKVENKKRYNRKKQPPCPLDSTPSNRQRKKGASCRRIETATGGFLYGTAVHKGGAIG